MSNLSSKIQTGPKNSLHFDSTKSVKQQDKTFVYISSQYNDKMVLGK